MIRIINPHIERFYPPPNLYIIKLFERRDLFASTSQTFSIARKVKFFYPVSTSAQSSFNPYLNQSSLGERAPPVES